MESRPTRGIIRRDEPASAALDSDRDAVHGVHLARCGETLYESFLTDLAGHRRLPIAPESAVETIDAFFGAVLAHRTPDTTLVLTSDHGNLETRSFKGHTVNPVPLIVAGPAAAHFHAVREITQVAPAILHALGCE